MCLARSCFLPGLPHSRWVGGLAEADLGLWGLRRAPRRTATGVPAGLFDVTFKTEPPFLQPCTGPGADSGRPPFLGTHVTGMHGLALWVVSTEWDAPWCGEPQEWGGVVEQEALSPAKADEAATYFEKASRPRPCGW